MTMTIYSEGILSIFTAQQISTLSLQVSRNVLRENFARILLINALFPFFGHILWRIRSYRIWKWNLSGSNLQKTADTPKIRPKKQGQRHMTPKNTRKIPPHNHLLPGTYTDERTAMYDFDCRYFWAMSDYLFTNNAGIMLALINCGGAFESNYRIYQNWYMK